MADKTGIQWTDATWNPVVGCARVSEGCRNCYAEKQAHRIVKMSEARGAASVYEDLVEHGPKGARWTGRAKCVPERLDQPLRWTKPRMVFVNSMSDLFHEDVPFEYIAAVFGVMAGAERHTFQVLTKRPARMVEFFEWASSHDAADSFAPTTSGGEPLPVCVGAAEDQLGVGDQESSSAWTSLNFAWCHGRWPLPNVWLGVSVEDQAAADERIPLLLQCPAAIRWISAEPLLGPVGLSPTTCPDCQSTEVTWGEPGSQPCCTECDTEMGDPAWLDADGLDWVVVGGESGPGARPCDVHWVRDIVRQCQRAQVSVFVKQLGARPAGLRPWCDRCQWQTGDGGHGLDCDRSPVVDHRKGADPEEWPEDLRVREWPGEAERGQG